MDATGKLCEKPVSHSHLESEHGCTAFTNGAFVVVRIGEPIRTLYEIPAPKVDNSEVSISGAGISRSYRVPEI